MLLGLKAALLLCKNKKTRVEFFHARFYQRQNLYEFLTAVVCVPSDRKNLGSKLHIYPNYPKDFYLGRHEKGDEHVVMTDDGLIDIFHTVRQIHMEISRMRAITDRHDNIKGPTGK